MPVQNLGHGVGITEACGWVLAQWVSAIQETGRCATTIHNVHGLIFSVMEIAVRAEYWPDKLCGGMRLPMGEKVGDDAHFLTLNEFAQLFDKILEPYKEVFVQFLVMTGTRFGEATAVTTDDYELQSRPETVRINKASKHFGNNAQYVGPSKTSAGRRTVSLPPALMELLSPLVAGRRGSEPLFTSDMGGRIVHSTFWKRTWPPAVTAAHDAGLDRTPSIHDLRHTHTSWLIHEGVPFFTISRRLGHASTGKKVNIYGHLMPPTLQEAADAMNRSAQRLLEQRGA